jgi:hypothetical protein
MAAGAAVILCHVELLGPMVTPRNFPELRSLNFALRSLSGPLREERLTEIIRQCDAGDTARVSEMAREQCELRGAVDRIVATYEKAIEDARQQPPPSEAERDRALVRYLEEAASHYKGADAELLQLRKEIASMKASATWRVGQRVLQAPLVRRLFGGPIQRVAGNSNGQATESEPAARHRRGGI